MATDTPNTPAAPAPAPKPRTAVTTEVQRDGGGSASVNMGMDGGGTHFSEDAGGASLEFDPRTGKAAGDPAAPAPAAAEPAPEGDQPATPVEPPAPAEAALPDFDPANEELRGQYDQRYFNEEGKLNLKALTSEFWGNAKDGAAGTLNEGTYKYLEETLGIPKDGVQSIEKGLVADQRASNSAFFNKVGGRARWDTALAWGRQNYTPEQQTRFNAAIGGDDAVARDEAIDALMGRFDRVNPRQGARRGPPRRDASPARSATATASPGVGGTSGAVPYATESAYTDAFSKAIAAEKAAKTPAERRDALQAREKVRADGRASRVNWK